MPSVLLQALVFVSIVWPPFVIRSIVGAPAGSGSDAADGDIVRQLFYLSIFILAILALLRDREATGIAIRRVNPWLWAFLAYVTLSIFWSSDPTLSAKRIVLLLGTALVSLAFVSASIHRPGSEHGLLSAIRPLMTIVILVSLVYSFSLPQLGTHHEGAWRGMAYDKNTFGQAAALCSLLWIIALRERAIGLGPGMLLLGISLLALVLARSTTSLVALTASVALLSLFACVTSVRRSLSEADLRSSYGAVCLIAFLTFIITGHILAVVLGYPTPIELVEQIANYLGKDLTLTGRTDLWQLIWDEITRHPWLGTGYHAFWDNINASAELRSGFTGGKGYGHSGYLDTLNELGILGLTLMGLVLLTHFFDVLRLYRSDPHLANGHILLLLSAVLLNFAETVLFQPTALWSAIMLISIMEVNNAVARHRAHERISNKALPTEAW